MPSVNRIRWGAPRVHGELLKLGFSVAQSTVSRYMPRKRPAPDEAVRQRWRTFLANHLGQAAGIDFFLIPTLTFRLLFGFVVLSHDRRRIVHFGVTEHPSGEWTRRHLLEAFPYESAPRFLHRDRDSIYDRSFRAAVKAIGIDDVPSAPGRPGKTRSPKESSARFAASCSTTSSSSGNLTRAECSERTSSTTTLRAAISRSTRTRRPPTRSPRP